MSAWNNWYHCTAHAYGTWLQDDPKGWRSRHHREHCEGDYKHPPPPGAHDHLFELSKRLMKRDPVRIQRDIRECVLQKMIVRLHEFHCPTSIGSLDGIHAHLLSQCNDRNPRIMIGIAKQYATAQLKAHGLAVGLNLQLGEGLWSKGSHPEPIEDERHFDNVHRYIADHANRGAVVIVPDPLSADPY